MRHCQYQLDRTVVIRATPETVFRFFTDPARWAASWGAGSTIDARLGGRLRIRHPNGVEVTGEVLEVHPSERAVFTYEYGSDALIQPGTSRVTIELARHGRRHAIAPVPRVCGRGCARRARAGVPGSRARDECFFLRTYWTDRIGHRHYELRRGAVTRTV